MVAKTNQQLHNLLHCWGRSLGAAATFLHCSGQIESSRLGATRVPARSVAVGILASRAAPRVPPLPQTLPLLCPRTRPVSSVAVAVDAAAADLARRTWGKEVVAPDLTHRQRTQPDLRFLLVISCPPRFNSSEEQHGGPLFIDSSSSISFSYCAKAGGQHISCLALISDIHTSDHADLHWTHIIGLGVVGLH
ncbi:hypothetical protein SORBI_3008G099500 [Sorghum bicolor]|uniref:Uncharacterized protein n=2 Tax=Sorghum bicolor TaxID=4558 RepID=A0A1Z5R5U7_SORBI|nr:hypothetical protein SORBI_3008G099500 [Sorghum bicolor]